MPQLQTDAATALAFLPFIVPVALWVAWSDMARMKIPNAAVLATVGVFLVIGPLAMPLAEWGWRWTHLVVVLLVGILANAAGLVGAGDAKFAAAAAPYVAVADVAPLAALMASLVIAAVAAHRLARRVPAIRRTTPHWDSWDNAKFPMGLALGPALAGYLALCLVHGA